MDSAASTVPRKLELVPKVADEPTCQKTLHAWAPLVSVMREPEMVVRVEPAWNTKTALGSPPASSVTSPVRSTDDAELYTPGRTTRPVRSPTIGWVGPSPAATLYAVVRSVCAPCVTASPAWLVPFTTIEPVPVIVVVGNVPKSPLSVVGPVLAMAAPARTTKLSAVPSGTVVATAWAVPGSATSSPIAATEATPSRAEFAPRWFMERFMRRPSSSGLRRAAGEPARSSGSSAVRQANGLPTGSVG